MHIFFRKTISQTRIIYEKIVTLIGNELVLVGLALKYPRSGAVLARSIRKLLFFNILTLNYLIICRGFT